MNNTIGGTTAGARNVICGNTAIGAAGILLTGSSGNLVEGNYIGTDVTGAAPLGNRGDGVYVNSGARGNTIGGTTAGAANVLSANGSDGVEISNSASTNVVEGNYIGTDYTGTAALGNNGDGVGSDSGATSNTIGGTTAAARNVISGNTGNGINLSSGSILVEGDYIGTNAAGTAALGNGADGVFTSAANNTIGGTAAGAGNVISGNYYGIYGGPGDLVQDNYIGTNAAGTAALGNVYGIFLGANNTIGGTAASAGNVISGNLNTGLYVIGAGNVIQGNYIGTNAAGTAALGNLNMGVAIYAASNLIGGTTAGAGNVISGNSQGGIELFGAPSTANLIEGNYIGTNAAGTAALGNGVMGVQIDGGANNNTVGGLTAAAHNIISGNASGIGDDIDESALPGAGTANNLVEGNYIGTDVTGAVALGNSTGISIDGSSNNTIGGTTAGARNVISGNTGDGLYITGSSATANVVQSNYIGTAANGTTALANGGYGVEIISGGQATVSGTVTGNLRNDGTLSPGGPGILTITGTYTQTANGILNLVLGGPNALDPDFDQIQVSGTATLDGTLNVSLINNYAPTRGTIIPVMTFASTTSDFATKTYANPGGGNALLAGFTPTSLVVDTVPTSTTTFWSNSSSGNWATASDWSTRSTPGSSDTVYIGPNVTVTHSNNVDTISSLTAGGSLVLSGGTLTVNGSLKATTPVAVSGGTLKNATVASGTTLTGANVSANPGTLDGVTLAGTIDLSKFATDYLQAANGLTLSSSTILLGTAGDAVNWGELCFPSAQTLAGTGTVTFGGSTSDFLDVGQGLTIASGITIHGQNGLIGGTNTNFTNHGTINADVAGGSVNISGGSWSSDGTVEATNGGTLNAGGSWTNTGLIAASGSTLNLNGSFTLASGST